ncbi:MAG: glycosyltransferase [Bacteroidia bacterium]
MLYLLLLMWGGYGYLLWRWGRWRLRAAPSPAALRVAVVIPARNEALNLPLCLASLLRQSRLPDEIWIVDDHSEDDTWLVACAWAARYAFIYPCQLPPTEKGKKAALRHAISRTTADIILTTDADTEHEPDTLAKIVAYFGDSAVQVVGGWVRLRPVGGWLGELQRIELAGLMGLTAGSWQRGEPITANGALLAYRRAAFEAVGGWGPAHASPSGDDDLLVQRICLHYGKKALAFSPAVVTTRPMPTWSALLHQRLRWLSKRRMYPTFWTPWGLRLVALAQMGLLLGLFLYPLPAVLAWLSLSAGQVWIAYRSFGQMRSPLPHWKAWLFTALVYPVYMTSVALIALIRPSFSWKGRTYS